MVYKSYVKKNMLSVYGKFTRQWWTLQAFVAEAAGELNQAAV